MAYEHIRIEREVPVNLRRRRRFVIPRSVPADIRAHGEALKLALSTAIAAQANSPAYDQRRLLKITVSDNFSPDEIEGISGVELVSQEEKTILLAFGDERALEAFESRLSTLAAGEAAVRQNLLFAIQGFDTWSEADRTGAALSMHGYPDEESFFLDVELWPLEHARERDKLVNSFRAWLNQNQFNVVDFIAQPSLLMFRVRADRSNADQLLRHRDVRMVDLPPCFKLDPQALVIDINEFPNVIPPEEHHSRIGVLDSGLTTGHPLIRSAVGVASAYVPGLDEFDEHGHGTMVAGLALYGDMEECIRNRNFSPEAHILSARILDRNLENPTGFIEKHIESAVRDFVQEYDCRIFNLSYGDLNKVYSGGHIRGLAYTLDR